VLQTNYLEEKFHEIDSNGWALIDLPLQFCQSMLAECERRYLRQEFTPAVVTQTLKDLDQNFRGDFTCWLKTGSTRETEFRLFEFLELLKTELSQFFRFNLSHFECHYAMYAVGKGYDRHSDQLLQNNQRFFSFVIYLNENWLPSDGGQLVGYEKDNIIFQVQPQIGKMILFKSALEHEVLAANRPRWSLTGWFRK
jgi:SM-20-related protein